MIEPLYVDAEDGKTVYFVATPFGCIVTKNPELHLRVMRALAICCVIGFTVGMVVFAFALLKGGA